MFWIIAADEGLRKQYGQPYSRWRDKHQHGHLFPGLRYARNKVAHESEAWDYEDRDVYTDRYTDRYGSWTWVQLPKPGKAPNKKVEQSWRKQFTAYNQHLRDKPVIDTTMDAVELLEEWWKKHGISPIGPSARWCRAARRPRRRPEVGCFRAGRRAGHEGRGGP